MVDSITSKAITIDGAATRVAAAAPVAAVAPVTGVATTPTSSAPVDIAQTSGLAQKMAAAPPVDTDRVATIKRAIADGRFPITPATIADRLIALKLQWNPNEAA